MADSFPVGPAYTSPGFAVSNTVDEILDKQKFERRQAMLDALNQQNVQSEIAARNENTAAQSESRRALAQDRMEQAFGRSIAPLHMGQSLSNMDPSILDTLIKRGVATPGVDPEKGAMGTSGISVDQGWGQPDQTSFGSIDPEKAASGASSLGTTAPKTNPTFNGSPAEQRGQEQFDNLQKLSRMDLSKYTPVQQWAIMKAYDPNGTFPTDLFKRQNDDEAPMMSLDEATQTLKPLMVDGKPLMGKKGARPVMIPRPPREPAEKTSQWVNWTTKDDQGNDVQHGGWSTPGSTTATEVDLPGVNHGNRPNPPKGKGDFDEALYQRWSKASSDRTLPDTVAHGYFSQLLDSIPNNLGGDTQGNVKADVRVIMNDPALQRGPISALVAKKVIQPPPNMPAEQQIAYVNKVIAILRDFGVPN